MPEVRAEDALAQETDLLGDALRRDVVGIGDEIDALELELVERMPGRAAAAHACTCPGRETMRPIQYPIVPR